ncbi:helix-turn-helix domain-containing protein [Bacillus paranthracis]|uniref:helix-turn-helix domain-containing protein n=1 Tax=Bacillus paranthracis TaxID=2026186 RepID=UPI00187A7564|nr:helix-turn-helix transcriptional regulator [Bacillus paranthracis]MBE7114326.1 helix-turn-helix domain-containing protein [Bacillus paranthracis]MBE7154801.1 helix-turn-helix domain-containing protein [Bacillus paranthracis]
MLTTFGKFCRKLRVDRDELLKDMAKKLDVTVSYLSAIENGKRNVPKAWLNKITEVYELDESENNKLKVAIDESLMNLKISLKSLDESDRYLVINLVRKIRTMGDKEKETLRGIIGD